MAREPYDVLVVGAGPSGSECARLLAGRGRHVALLDENAAARETVVCTGIVGREAFERVRLPEGPVVDVIRRARFYSPSRIRVRYDPPEPLAHVVDRTRFDSALADRAAESGAELLRGHAARGVERDEDGVTVRCEVEGGIRRIRGRSLVVATGHQRWLHEEAGLGTPPGYVHGVHADLPFSDLDAAELYFGSDVAPGFFAWAVPFGAGTARLGVLAPQGSRRHFRRFIRLEPIRSRLGLDLHSGGMDRALAALHSRGIVQGMVSPSYADRTLAVGEAAGQVKTTTAGGIYYGMLGAEMAADRLDEALGRNALDAESLAPYEDRWHDRLGREIRSGLELQERAGALSDGEIDRLFEALRGGIAATVRQVVRFDWHRSALGVLFRHRKLWRHFGRDDGSEDAATAGEAGLASRRTQVGGA